MSVFKKYISHNEEESKPASSKESTNYSQPNQPAQSSQHTQTRDSSPAQSGYQTTPATTSTLAASNGRNVLSSDVEIKGKVKFTNDLVVDGLIEGEIFSDGSLTVGENARIKAEVHTRSVVVYGKVHGNITVTDRVELKANAELIGDIKAATISIEAGAIFVGKSTVGVPSTQITASPATDSVNDETETTSKTETINAKGKLAAAS